MSHANSLGLGLVLITLVQATHAETLESQPLADAIQTFIDHSGLQIVYESSIAVDKVSSNADLSGSNEQVLTDMLAGTGVEHVFLNSNTVALKAEEDPGVEKPQPAPESRSRTPDVAASESNEPVMEEVIVTAQIRRESLQDVPVSGTAFSGEILEANRLTEIDDVARFTPGLTGSFFNYSSPIIAIRGANNTFSQAGASKPVGIFLDDVFIPRYSASSFDLFDLEQVTVLRGPQGTLFGRNVTGGAIQVQTTQPSETTRVKARISAGNEGYTEFAGYVSGALADNLFGKVTTSVKQRDGFAKDRFNGQELEDLDSVNLRAGLVFQPTDDLELRLSADYAKDENGGRSLSLISSNDGTDRTGNDGDRRSAEIRAPQSYDREIFGLSAHVDWETDAGLVQSITAIRRSDAEEQYSLGAGDVSLPSVSTQFLKDERDEPDSFSQEFRLISQEYERLSYVAGIYYYREDTNRYVGDILLGINGFATFVDRNFNVNADTKSLAAYVSVDFRLSDTLTLGLGGRYTKEDKDIDVVFVDNNNTINNFTVSESSDFSEFTPRITMTWQPVETITMFASATEGFTAGGYNTETNNATAIALGFDPEKITAVEIGIKSQWADNRLITNLTLFDQEYEDKQEGFFTPAGPYFSIFNASEASMKGAELEVRWAATTALDVSVTYATLDTEYDRFVIPLGADYSGNDLQTAPDQSFSIALDYSSTLKNGMALSWGVTYSWQDEYYTGASNIDDFLIDSYGLFGGRLGLTSTSGTWKTELWGKNLGDKDFVRVRGNSGALAEHLGAPRTYGVSLTYQPQ